MFNDNENNKYHTEPDNEQAFSTETPKPSSTDEEGFGNTSREDSALGSVNSRQNPETTQTPQASAPTENLPQSPHSQRPTTFPTRWEGSPSAPQQPTSPPQQPPASINDYYRTAPPTPQKLKSPIRRASNIHALGLGALELISYQLIPYLYIVAGVILGLDSNSANFYPDLYELLEIPFGVKYQIFDIFVFFITLFVPTMLMIIVGKHKRKLVFPMRKVNPAILIGAVGIGLGAAEVGSYLSMFLSNTIYTFSEQLPYAPDFGVPRGGPATVLFFISLAVMPAIFEELMFRGVILQSLRRFGDGFALIVSSVLFGIFHGNLTQAPFALVLGLVIGYFVLLTGSLWPGILIHFFNNLISGLITVFTANTTYGETTFIYNAVTVFKIIFAIASLIGLKLHLGSLFFIPKSKYPIKDRDKYVAYFLTSALMVLYLIYQGIRLVTNMV